jgi:hypothetical protein
MRLSDWRARAPVRDAVSTRVGAVVDPVLMAMGAEADPEAWVAWGDDPSSRYTVFVPTAAGLISCFVRVNLPGEGPRAAGKLVRWPRVSIGELGIETQAGRRLVTFQLEQSVIRGIDEDADLAAHFALQVFAALDGRPGPSPLPSYGRPRRTPAGGNASRGPKRPPSRATSTAKGSP